MKALPDRGFVFWPVGCGDSTTVVIDSETVLQIDLHHVEESENEDDPRVPIIDELVVLLPGGSDDKPYLAAFGATRLDKDHVQGFAELLEKVTIGDLGLPHASSGSRTRTSSARTPKHSWRRRSGESRR